MDHEQKINELYALVYRLITELDSLKASNAQLQKENARLRQENQFLKQELEKYRTPKNSGNSSKPPSSDFPKIQKTQSLRTSSGKKPGGQPGHEGTTLKMADTPDAVQQHIPNYCTCCGEDLSHYQTHFIGRRQVIDIPPIKPIVTEHRLFEVHCRCGHNNQASYPEGILAPVSYGPGVQSLVAYLSTRQYIPVERTTELLSNLFGLSLSTGGVCYLLEKTKQKALPVYEHIRELILNGRVTGGDETGVNINGENQWAWVFQNIRATFIAIHKSRGSKAITEIMPEGFRDKVLVTDCWTAYFKEGGILHQLCTAHLLRELNYFGEKYPANTWVDRMSGLIRNALDMRKENRVTPQKSEEIKRTFLILIQEPINKDFKDLITFQKRMVKYSGHAFMFLDDPEIPPDNNASERAIRNFKVKQKVSGFFKSKNGADVYAVLRSIIDTSIKNGQNPFIALRLMTLSVQTE
jgi:transposase